jgi:hypothetical protein
MEQHNVARLEGAPPGYIGYEEGASIPKRSDASLHGDIADEIEKAHPNVYTSFYRSWMTPPDRSQGGVWTSATQYSHDIQCWCELIKRDSAIVSLSNR